MFSSVLRGEYVKLRDLVKSAELMGTEEFSKAQYENKRLEVYNDHNKPEFWYAETFRTMQDSNLFDKVGEEPVEVSITKFDNETKMYVDGTYNAKRYKYIVNQQILEDLTKTWLFIDNILKEESEIEC